MAAKPSLGPDSLLRTKFAQIYISEAPRSDSPFPVVSQVQREVAHWVNILTGDGEQSWPLYEVESSPSALVIFTYVSATGCGGYIAEASFSECSFNWGKQDGDRLGQIAEKIGVFQNEINESEILLVQCDHENQRSPNTFCARYR